jgi:hypothetical protein
MVDAHIRAWRRHCEREFMRLLIANKANVTTEWRRKMAIVQANRQALIKQARRANRGLSDG